MNEALVKRILRRLDSLDVDLSQLPLCWLDEVQAGRSMFVVARNLPCLECKRRHRTAICVGRALPKHPRKYFKP